MRLRAGIPLASEVQQLVANGLFQRHVQFNEKFHDRHAVAMKAYGKQWAVNPLLLWSRRWEYPFVAQRLIDFAAEQGAKPMKILDAGSGVTYFGYLICDTLPNAEVICCDSDPSYHGQFAAINAATPGSRVSFIEAMLQKLPFPSASVDAICCISVLEHTDRYEQILDEFARILRPGGQFVLTFDLSLDGKFELSFDQASALLKAIEKQFSVFDQINPIEELARMKKPDGLLSTDSVRYTEPDLLPWKYPMLKGLHDLLKGKGWTGGFRSKSVFCLETRRR